MGSIIDYYNQFDEWGRLEREPVEFMVNLHFIKQYLKPGTHVLDNGAGRANMRLRWRRKAMT